MERKKIELRNASAAIGNVGNFARPAGAAQTGNNNNNKDARNSAVAVPNHLGSSPGPGASGQRKGG